MKSTKELITSLGCTHGRPPAKTFGIKYKDRQFHTCVFGMTGTGKSTWLLQLAKQDLQHSHGFCLIDPHGDLAKLVKEVAGDDIIYWDIGDPNCGYGYNPLTHVSEQYRPLVASGIIDMLKHLFRDSFGVRMEHIMRMTFLALLSRPNSSMEDIMPMYLDKPFRYEVLHHVTDDYVRAFWTQEFAKLKYTSVMDGVSAIANKMGTFMSNPVVRNKICQPEKPLRFRKIMDEGTVLIVNLAKGRLGPDVANVVGGMIVSGFSAAALSRENIPLEERVPYSLVIDEFPVLTTEAFANQLSEMRKYKLALCLVAQHTTAITELVLQSIWGNVGNLISFRVGATDAPIIAKQLGADTPTPRDLVNLPNYQMFVKMMVDGVQSRPFSARSLAGSI